MKKKKNIKPLNLALLIFFLLVLALFVLFIKYFYLDKKSSSNNSTANSYTKGIHSGSVNKNQPVNKSGDSVNSQTTNSNSSTVTLIQPFGSFVSNHHPNLSGYPAPNILSSVCNTTPGAYCEITFTSGGITKYLQKKVTDSGGAAYWNNWSVQSIGLTEGSWHIQAIASLNGQTKSSTDPMELIISQ